MTGTADINPRGWRLSRRAFVVYIAVLVMMVVGFVSQDVFGVYFGALEVWLWLTGAVMLLCLPLVLSMRFRDFGQSALWPLLPLTGLLVLAFRLFVDIASIGGTPGSSPQSLSAKVADVYGFACLVLAAAMSLAGMLLPSKFNPNEVPQ